MALQPPPPFPSLPQTDQAIPLHCFAAAALESDAAYSRIIDRLWETRLAKTGFADQRQLEIKTLHVAALALVVFRKDMVMKAQRYGQLLFCWHGTKATEVV